MIPKLISLVTLTLLLFSCAETKSNIQDGKYRSDNDLFYGLTINSAENKINFCMLQTYSPIDTVTNLEPFKNWSLCYKQKYFKDDDEFYLRSYQTSNLSSEALKKEGFKLLITDSTISCNCKKLYQLLVGSSNDNFKSMICNTESITFTFEKQ